MAVAALSAPEILFVCTANVCRSPYMEYKLRAMLAARSSAEVSIGSAGTRALQGHEMAAPLSQRLRDRGTDPSGFRAVPLRREMLESAAIVVTATREHRRQVVQHSHAAADRTFTLAQLARLLGAAPADASASGSVAELVIAAHGARGKASETSPAFDDLDDPWRRSPRIYRRVADRIDDLLIPMAARLAGRR
ncbi:low molecular weight phosphatase family protein [Microbacterium abyssi]|uniref:arsenate reductase/protein-tyrosine-phosphatase family protein n=1 Tax=Microbacterium abyssi TaxID=2782166 RepID=UPI001887F1C0|nr:low molecular weight phosphatase family protein [Microbacterium sp. A18JL241]